jgi:hypothetical protein
VGGSSQGLAIAAISANTVTFGEFFRGKAARNTQSGGTRCAFCTAPVIGFHPLAPPRRAIVSPTAGGRLLLYEKAYHQAAQLSNTSKTDPSTNDDLDRAA